MLTRQDVKYYSAREFDSTFQFYQASLLVDRSEGKLLLPYWYLISRVLNFAILARQYFAGFFFRDFNRQIWKKGIKFRDWSVLNFILFFQRSELFKVSR